MENVNRLCKQILSYLIEENYLQLEKDGALKRVTSNDIQRVLYEYDKDGKLTMQNDEYFVSENIYVCEYDDKSGYHVDIDLWINGRKTDLILQIDIKINSKGDIIGYQIDDIRVL